ncbi:hypothetical protein AM1BK_16260 [Neobacillus kokaensis]|uniref:Uncharacterized protein n=1 Tax=Neobacillus kokaensis TaxID=2759023 RepID=A0ABQ3N268_9BACI|nr:hypothetical protein AM1BK_16260 [Neobacillus kokaensis]
MKISEAVQLLNESTYKSIESTPTNKSYEDIKTTLYQALIEITLKRQTTLLKIIF